VNCTSKRTVRVSLEDLEIMKNIYHIDIQNSDAMLAFVRDHIEAFKGRKKMSYDSKCYELAEYFFGNKDPLLQEVAQEIQDAIESFASNESMRLRYEIENDLKELSVADLERIKLLIANGTF